MDMIIKVSLAFLLLPIVGKIPLVSTTECWRRKITAVYFAFSVNNTIKCPMTFQWTVNDFCCYDKFDDYDERPYCCYSDAYKLAVAVGFICLVLISASFSLFCCWACNIPHHLLYILTCRKFHLNDWLAKTRTNGPYVDPSFYSGEPPFWAPGAHFLSPYPLRPMPPRIFYPAPPPSHNHMNFRFEMGHHHQGDLPLFILASRQFHRNPYSARPNNDHRNAQNVNSFITGYSSSSVTNPDAIPDSRRSSIVTLSDRDNNNSSNHQYNNHSRSRSGQGNSNPHSQMAPFHIKMDEVEAAAELIEAIRMMESKSEFKSASEAEDKGGQGGGGGNWYDSSSNDTASPKGSGGGSAATPRVTSGLNNLNKNGNSGERGGSGCSGGGPQSLSSEGTAEEEEFNNQSTMSNNSSSNNSNNGSQRNNKMSVELMNQQLSSSLGMSIQNLPNVHVIGNFTGGGGSGNSGMETIVEDDSLEEEGLDYYNDDDMMMTPPGTGNGGGGGSSNGNQARGRDFNKSRRNSSIVGGDSNNVITEPLRISSALDRIVTRARAEIPFRPSLPGLVPDNTGGGSGQGGVGNVRSPRSSRKQELGRRNSAPVNF